MQKDAKELISQGKAAVIAGLKPADFIEALFRAKVPACQINIEQLKEELGTWQRLSGESRRRPGSDEMVSDQFSQT